MEINYVCSLGKLCFSASLIKKNNYRFCSFPFDWCFTSPKVITHCLEDKFKTFLDKSNYINLENFSYSNSYRICAHRLYQYYVPNSLIDHFFNHKDPRQEIDYQYYIRCINRFYNLLDKPEYKLFIISYTDLITEPSKSDIDDINILNKTLSNYTNNYKILVIFHQVKNEKKYNLIKEDNIDYLYLYTESKCNGIEFLNKDDNEFLNSIISSNYKIKPLIL